MARKRRNVVLLGAMLAASAVPVVLRAAPVMSSRADASAVRAPDPGAELAARRRRELDALQRQDAAAALAAQGVAVDWRAHSLEALLDMRLRVAKAAALRQLGIVVEWRRHDWQQMDRVARALSGPQGRAEARAEELITPTFAPIPPRRGTSGDLDAVLAPTFAGRRLSPAAAGDPDAVLTPTFSARGRRMRAGQGPDGLLTPTFMPVAQGPLRAPEDSDALLMPVF
jgi:hypothetical protein